MGHMSIPKVPVSAFARLGQALALVWLSVASAAVALPEGASNQLPASLDRKVQAFRSNLVANGYDVVRGEFHLFTIEDCKYAIQSIGNCLGNNPTAPYVIPTVPLWPDEYVDPHMKNLLGPVANKTRWTHRLDQQEAVVIMAQLPPTGRYFGLQPYIFTREESQNFADPIYRSLKDPFMKSILFMNSPNPSRPLVFSSLGDSVNNVVIERQSGAAFDQQRYFIITADERMANRLHQALLRAGVRDGRHIFTIPVSPSLARLGLGATSDDFMTLIRYAMPNDEAAGERWRHELPMAIFRVRDKEPSHAAQPFAAPIREARGSRSELSLKDDVDDLVAAVKQRWGQAAAPDSPFRSLLLTVDLVGEHCLKRPMNCLGDSSDADYQISETVDLDSGEVLAVVGTLGKATGNATYTSLSVNRIPEVVGVLNLTDKDLVGTASTFSATVANADKLYVQYFARTCTKLPNCQQVTEQLVPKGGQLKIIQRNYVVPGMTRGPAPDRLVNPRMIVFKGGQKN